jgi:hypothetical protein
VKASKAWDNNVIRVAPNIQLKFLPVLSTMIPKIGQTNADIK